MAGDIQPLDQSFAIVKPDGMPTEYFIWWAQQRQIDIQNGITVAQAQQLIDDWAAMRNIFAGTGLDGGGPLSANVTINLADTAVTPGTYGDAANVPQITIDPQGRVTSAVDVPISGGGGGSWTLVDQNGAAIVFATVTITIASPGVVSLTAHGFAANQAVVFNTTGALPTGLTAGTTYYVRNPAANTFEVSATVGGASINTTGTQSGVHSVRKEATWTFSAATANVDTINLGSFDELMVIVRNVSSSISGQRAAVFSVNNGLSFFTTSGDYINLPSTGAEAGTTIAATHATASALARTFWMKMSANQSTSIKYVQDLDTTQRLFVASFLPVNAVRIFNLGGGNLTSGSIYVFGR